VLQDNTAALEQEALEGKAACSLCLEDFSEAAVVGQITQVVPLLAVQVL
jgi:hypothetical protein